MSEQLGLNDKLAHAPKARALLIATGILTAATLVAGCNLANQFGETTDFGKVSKAELEMFALGAAAFASRKASYTALREVRYEALGQGKLHLIDKLREHGGCFNDAEELPVLGAGVASAAGVAANVFMRTQHHPHIREVAGVATAGLTALTVMSLSGTVSDYRTLKELTRPKVSAGEQNLAT